MKFTQAVQKHFKNGLLRKVPGSKYWMVAEEFVFFVNYDTKIEFIIIPKGFKTDFGSIPKILQNIFSPTKFISYIFHDYLYSGNYISRGEQMLCFLPTRKETDKILDIGLKIEGMGMIKRGLVYYALRLFGFRNFKKIESRHEKLNK